MKHRTILPKKVYGLKLTEHFKERMLLRHIDLTIVEEVLQKREIVKYEPWKDRIKISAMTERGLVTVITNSNKKSLKTCWVC